MLDLLGKTGKILGHPGNGDAELWRYVGLRLPQLVARFLPFAVLLGTLITFAGLNQNSEIISMKAAGISAHQIIAPLILAVGADRGRPFRLHRALRHPRQRRAHRLGQGRLWRRCRATSGIQTNVAFAARRRPHLRRPGQRRGGEACDLAGITHLRPHRRHAAPHPHRPDRRGGARRRLDLRDASLFTVDAGTVRPLAADPPRRRHQARRVHPRPGRCRRAGFLPAAALDRRARRRRPRHRGARIRASGTRSPGRSRPC